MKTALLVATRALGRLAGQATTGFAVGAFLAVLGALFAEGLFAAEGKTVSVSSVWAIAAANALPLLTSLLTMRLWSDDGNPGRTEIDLVAPVPERAFAFGRFLAAYVATVLTLLVSLAAPVVVLPRCAPALAADVSVLRLLPSFVALSLWAIPLVAFGSLTGVFFRRAAPAAVTSFALTCALPYAAYQALLAWSPAMRMMFAEPPLEALLADAADGRFSAGAVASVFAFACFAVFTTSKIFALRRLAGGGRFVLKVSSAVAIACALLATTLFSLLAQRLDFSVEWAGVSRASSFSARTREILSGTSQEVLVTACLRRNAPEFLAVSRLLRAFETESRNLASAGVRCVFVDPRWDPNAAARVVRRGGGEGMLVFSAGRRRIVVPAKEVDESICASAIQRLSMPAKHEAVMFTAGHGEPSVSDIGPLGLSDAAQVLKQEGYHISTLFSATSPIPSDCAVLAVIGPRTPFSEAERRDIGKFLLQGGRLLATVSSVAGSGLEGLLETYGLSVDAVRGNERTTDGADIVVSDFGDHAVSGPLTGSVVVFAPDAVRLKAAPPTSAPEGGFSFTALCGAETSAYALAGERGTALKSDLAIHPARLVLIGDSSFLGNAALASRANANRDFFLNAVAWLAGLDVSGSPGMGGNVISARMDRRLRIRFVLFSVVGVPVALGFFVLIVRVWKRRRRK